MGRARSKASELKTTLKELAEEIDSGDDAELVIREIESEIDATAEDVRWSVHVSRVKPNSKNEPFLFSCDPAEMTGLRERLRDRYGTGLYRVRVRKNGQIARQYDLAVEQELNANPVRGMDGGLEHITARLVDMMDQRFAKIEERIGKPEGTLDELTRIKTIAELMKTLSGNQAIATGGPNLNEMLGFFTAALNLGRELGGSDSGAAETNFADVMKTAIQSGGLERIGEVLTSIRRPQMVATAQDVAAIGPPAGEVQGIMEARPVPQNAVHMQDKRAAPSPAAALIGPALSGEMQKLIAAAKRGSNVALYAEYLTDSLPDPAMAYILNNDRVLADLEKAFPEVASVRDWFAALLQEILAMNSEEEGSRAANVPGNDTGRPGGNRNDPQDHAPNGKDLATGAAD